MSSRYASRRGCVVGVLACAGVVMSCSVCCMAAFVGAVLIASMAALRAQPWATPQSVCILCMAPVLSRQREVVGRVYQLVAVGAVGGIVR